MNRPESDFDALCQDLRAIWDGDPWHGSSITAVLEGVTAERASTRPLPGAHSIWELVLHMTVWAREVTSRIRGAAPKSPPEDWPAPPRNPAPDAWRAAQADLAAAHAELGEVVRSVGAGGMLRWIVDERDPFHTTGLTVGSLVRGLLQHHAYHQGQIAQLKKGRG